MTFERPGPWIAIFAAYVALQAMVRIVLGDVMNVDEAEAWLWAQHLDWGYGPQPPLYIWLQRVVFTVTGPTAAGLAAMKALTLFAIALAVFSLARRWVLPGQVALAGLATAALIWLPELSWESQRIRTHNVLTAALAIAALGQVLRLRDAPRGRDFVLLGLIFGFGLLSKWNFVLLMPGLLIALACAPGGRAALMRPAAFWLLLPLPMVAPTLVWMLYHPDVAFASFDKLGMVEDPAPFPGDATRWIRAVAENALSFAALPAIVLGALALAGRGRAPEGLSPPARVEMRIAIGAAALSFGLLVLAGLIGGATQLRARWLLPIVLPALPAIALWVLARATVRARRVFAAASGALALLLLIAIGAMLRLDPPMKHDPLDARIASVPDAAQGEPILGKVEVVANLQARLPGRLFLDQALAMAGDCPARLWILDPGATLNPRLEDWLAHCGLAAGEDTGTALHYLRP